MEEHDDTAARLNGIRRGLGRLGSDIDWTRPEVLAVFQLITDIQYLRLVKPNANFDPLPKKNTRCREAQLARYARDRAKKLGRDAAPLLDVEQFESALNAALEYAFQQNPNPKAPRGRGHNKRRAAIPTTTFFEDYLTADPHW